MKKIYLLFCALFTYAFNSSANFLDEISKNKIKSVAFDSMDDDDDYDDDSYDPNDDEDSFKGKKGKLPRTKNSGGGWKPSTGYFTLNITNNIAGNQQIELFNSLRSFSSVTNSALSAFNPFTFTNRDAVNANSTIVFAPNGDLIITSAAGTILSINCPDIPYRVLLETLKFYSINIRELKFGFTNMPQLSNILNFTEQTFLGKITNNTTLPKAYFKDFQVQTKQVSINQGFMINGERGINFLVNQSEIIDMTFFLSAIRKG